MPPSEPATWLLEAARHGARPAVVANGCALRYRDLPAEAARRAARLDALGAPRDAVLAVETPHQLHRALALLTALHRGSPVLMVPAGLAPEHRAALLAACAPAALTGPAAGSVDPPGVTRIGDGWLQGPPEGHPAAPPAPRGAGEVQLLVATSGTTGAPRAAMLTGASLAAAVHASAAVTPLAPGDTWLACLPLDHIGGLAILLRSLAAGATMRLHQGFDGARVWRELAAGAVTHASLVPPMLARLLEASGGAAPHPALRAVLVGGGPLPTDLGRRALAAGWPLRPTYGMSETAAQVATLADPGPDWRQGQVGPPLPGLQVDIVPGDGTLEQGAGRIRVAGPMVMAGYATPGLAPGRGLDGDGAFVTGDLGRLDAQGRLQVLGRADGVLVSGGHRVHPQEVEDRLAACPGVTEVVVTGTPDPVWGHVITAWVTGPADAGAVEAWARAALPSRLRPRRVHHLPELPRLPSGKPDRRRLQG